MCTKILSKICFRAVNLNSTNASEENTEWSEGKSAYNDIGGNDAAK